MWHGIEGHDDVVERFRRACARAVGEQFLVRRSVGHRQAGVRHDAGPGAVVPDAARAGDGPLPCMPLLHQVAAGSHPDMTWWRNRRGSRNIPLALLIGDNEHRRREGLCHNIALKPYLGGRKVAVIDDADDLNEEGANALLKTLEEPPPRSVLILIGTTPAKQLPTIRSRCQLVRFRPLQPESVASLLVSKGYVSDPAEARRLAELGEGSVGRAWKWPTRRSRPSAVPWSSTLAGRSSSRFRWPRRSPPSSTPRARKRRPGGPGSPGGRVCGGLLSPAPARPGRVRATHHQPANSGAFHAPY